MAQRNTTSADGNETIFLQLRTWPRETRHLQMGNETIFLQLRKCPRKTTSADGERNNSLTA
jgi:hypothetical protein